MDRIKEFIEDHLYQTIGGLALVSAILLLGLVFAVHGNTQSETSMQSDIVGSADSSTNLSTNEQSSSADEKTETSSQRTTNLSSGGHKQIYVDVKGAVRNPGVYQVNPNMRICDAVDLAGGFNKSADKKQVNLAQRLSDQQVVYIPIRGEIKGNQFKAGAGAPANPNQSEEVTAANDDGSSTTDSESEGNQINLNTADKTKLQELTGIGEKKADQIIAYRKEHGDFKKIEDLKEVPGFGDKTFANLKSSICV